MPILKTANNKLRLQLNSQYPADRVPKSIFCVPYAIGAPQISPSEGKISFSPTNKPSQVTSIQINNTTLLGSDLKTFFDFTTEGSLIIYERANADNSIILKINSPQSLSNSTITQYSIPEILSYDAVSFFNENTQVCIFVLSAPTSEALTSIDGGYYP
jgi:hypothetical protein